MENGVDSLSYLKEIWKIWAISFNILFNLKSEYSMVMIHHPKVHPIMMTKV